MKEESKISDAAERLRALDPTQSFIVQAPAGSGKTGLLIQRYLRLLATVNMPEEVVAITFTRKAAAEMRERVLGALEAAKSSVTVPDNPYEKLTHDLSIAVLQRDKQENWQIAENPVRLRIQTIDSLCASLTRQMPILSKFGAQPETIEDAHEFYLKAARATIQLVEQNHTISHDIRYLLEHLDNDLGRVEGLLSDMLARRDHWLRHIHGKTRDELESALKNVRNGVLRQLNNLFPKELQNELLHLIRYAAENLLADEKPSSITACENLVSLPDNVAQWSGIAELLLKKDGDWRGKLDIRQGFPPGKTKDEKEAAKDWKNRAALLGNRLQSDDLLRQKLHDVRLLPPMAYTDKQWELLGAITRLLPFAVAQLKIVFQLYGRVDFTEVAQAALQALGDEDMPTDLALALECRIKHILVDEFQDTSISQYQLIEKLVVGWQQGDGHSLFAVGDPMQSIYRFREAEVGLFLKARQLGIGDLELEPIILSSNFRSQQGIIDWVNKTFTVVMPVDEDIATGAVSYTPSVATRKLLGEDAVMLCPMISDNNAIEEAEKVVDIVLQSQQKGPSSSIAILVRSRSHLKEIVPKIKEVGLNFRAVEIESLGHRPVVQDLLALTRALINPADRLAWLAVLRAPWCGLTLTDLQALVTATLDIEDKDSTVWELLENKNYWQTVSDDGKIRLNRVCDVLAPCILNRCRQSLRITVEVAWQALGGPTGMDVSEQTDAMLYLDYIEDHEEAGDIKNINVFEQGLDKLYASHNLEVNENLQIMTIHKAKGLEFDTVIVPGLARRTRSKEKRLLKWMENPMNDEVIGGSGSYADLLLAPIQEAGEKDSAIYKWLDKLESAKELFEIERLLYVAVTRAKKSLYLLGNANLMADKDGNYFPVAPADSSLLGRLWPVVQESFMNHVRQYQSGEVVEEKVRVPFRQLLYRLPADWRIPIAPDQIDWTLPHKVNRVQPVEFSWAGEIARHIGNVVHRWLQKIAEDEMKDWRVERIIAMRDTFAQELMISGVNNEEWVLEEAVKRVIRALTNVITDRRGQWLLSAHKDAQNELCLSGVVDGQSVDLVIDRTFCDLAGNRWIVDYKTSSHEGSDIEAFLDRECTRYRQQLERYALVMKNIDLSPIRLGLYFPLLKGWREWHF